MPGQDAAAAPAVSPRASAAFAASFKLFRTRPVVSCALGAAVGFSLLSVCCGLGFATTPYFICELMALQLSAFSGRSIERSSVFFRAGALVFGAMLMIGAVLVISLLGSAGESSSPLTPTAVAVAMLGSAAAWTLITPLSYAPIMLIERAHSAELALAESAHLTMRAGVIASVRLNFAAFCLQLAPFALAIWLISVDDARAALWALLCLPLACVSVPLGQGMLVWTYVQIREPAVLSRALPEPQRRWIRVWALLIVLPIASLVLLELLLSRPSRINEVLPDPAPSGETLHVLTPAEREASVELPSSTLTLRASARQVSVAASDGGGVGELPLAAAGPIERVRVVRVRDTFAIYVEQGGKSYLTRIDRAGVRLDDDLPARLRDRSQPWQWLFLLWTLIFTLLSSVPVLSELAASSKTEGLRRARLLSLLLLPWGVGCLTMALYALFTA